MLCSSACSIIRYTACKWMVDKFTVEVTAKTNLIWSISESRHGKDNSSSYLWSLFSVRVASESKEPTDLFWFDCCPFGLPFALYCWQLGHPDWCTRWSVSWYLLVERVRNRGGMSEAESGDADGSIGHRREIPFGKLLPLNLRRLTTIQLNNQAQLGLPTMGSAYETWKKAWHDVHNVQVVVHEATIVNVTLMDEEGVFVHVNPFQR